MANPFEMLGQMQLLKDRASELLSQTDSGWFIRAGTAMMLQSVLQIALDAGPPHDFAEQLGVDDAQARVIYDRVLRAALLRQRQAVFNGRG